MMQPSSSPDKKTAIGIAVAILTALAFGFYPPATRAVYAHGGNAVFIILLTTFMRAFSLTAFCLATNRPLFRNRADVKIAVWNGFFQALSISCILAAMKFLAGPLVITIVFSYVLMLYAFMIAKGEEQFSKTILLLVVVVFTGLGMVLNVQNSFNGLRWEGVGLAFLAAMATTTRVYVYGKLAQSRDPAVIGAEAFLFAAVFVCLLLFHAMPVLPDSTLGAIWSGVAALSLSAGSFGMFYGIALLGAFRFSLFSKLEPVFGALLAALLIGETLNTGQYIGMAIVIGGLALYQILRKR